MKRHEFYRAVGQRMREARRARGLSQAALGEALAPAVDKAVVSKWERGQREVPAAVLPQIAEALGEPEALAEYLLAEPRALYLADDAARRVNAAYRYLLEAGLLEGDPAPAPQEPLARDGIEQRLAAVREAEAKHGLQLLPANVEG